MWRFSRPSAGYASCVERSVSRGLMIMGASVEVPQAVAATKVAVIAAAAATARLKVGVVIMVVPSGYGSR